jgi:Tfp pilus assembly protein PilN
MIRTNLATRPFYNERAVRAWLFGVLILVLAATAFNVSRVLRYARSDTRLATQASGDEARAADLRQQANRLRATVDPKLIESKSTEARVANELIDRRTFSWTELFNRLETTLPDEVRIVSVRPHTDRTRATVLIGITVVARGVDDVNAFNNNLEQTGAFTRVRSLQERYNERGEFEAQIEGQYEPGAAAANGGGAAQP